MVILSDDDHSVTRREALASLLATAGTFIVTARQAFAGFRPGSGSGAYHFPQGVASGDPTHSSVVLWTRAERRDGSSDPISLIAQVSRTPDFAKVVAERKGTVTTDSDHTFRLIVENLDPSTTYYYRFIADGDVSKPLGRTRTAPPRDADRAVNFAYISCQHLQLGYMTPLRRLIAEDHARDASQQLDFVLHLGDFIYEEIWYPEDRKTFLRRRIRDTVRLPDGGGRPDWRWPVSLADYRTIYKAYLMDPDLKAARARWPFICVWDDHEFSNNSWQTQQVYDEPGQAAQRRKVAANQAWFEFIPAFLTGNPGVKGVEQTARDFGFVDVENAPLTEFNDQFQSREPNNLAALNSLRINRSLRWGRHVELILTDNRSFRSPPVFSDGTGAGFSNRQTPWWYPEDVIRILDAGRHANDGNPPQSIEFGSKKISNPRSNSPSGTLLGPDQKRWFKATLEKSDATWKVWGNSVGALPRRIDFHNLPEADRQHWKGEGYAVYGTDDWVAYPAERAELLNHIAQKATPNVVSLTGDRHNFFAGYLSQDLPPGDYKPVAVEFTTSSITTPTSFEAAEYVFDRAENPKLEYFAVRRHDDGGVEPAVNISISHGVKAAKTYGETGSLKAALAQSNPEVAPHLVFADMSTHGYATARVDASRFQTELVAFRRPLRPSSEKEGIAPLYRKTFEVRAWNAGGQPQIRHSASEGELPVPYGRARFFYGQE